MRVADLEDRKDFQFISDSQEVNEVKVYFGEIATEFDSFFAQVVDGEYGEVFGMFGIVPYLTKPLFKVV